jgi:hypothetical protein
MRNISPIAWRHQLWFSWLIVAIDYIMEAADDETSGPSIDPTRWPIH